MNLLDLFESDHSNDCHLCKGTGEGLFDGESCPVCDGTGIEPKSRDDDDVYDVDDYDDADYGDEESYYEKSLRNRGLGEGAGDIGAKIKAAYQKIYNQGDDAVEFAYNDSPIFAQYWDEYEGDLDSIIAEVEPSELQIILDELEAAAEEQGVAEAAKKKDDDFGPEIRDVSLNRAITRAKSDFPTAGSGIEALAKDFMRSQDQDQTAFDQLRQAERKQDQMLSQISKIDQEQEQEIQSLDNQNSTLAKRLQQLQSVNSELEKKLAAMSGRKEKRKGKDATSYGPSSTTVPAVTAAASTEPAKAKKDKTKTKAKATLPKSSIPATAAQLKAKTNPLAAMSQRITKGDTSVLDKVTGQSALPFEPSDNVLEPVIPQQQRNPRFDAARANASDAEAKYYRDLTSKIAKDTIIDPEKAKQTYTVHENDNEEQEADYDDKYQDMVARVGQKAREQEKNKPVDIADLARRLAAIEASHKDSK